MFKTIHSGENWTINGFQIGTHRSGEHNPENIKDIKIRKIKIHKNIFLN